MSTIAAIAMRSRTRCDSTARSRSRSSMTAMAASFGDSKERSIVRRRSAKSGDFCGGIDEEITGTRVGAAGHRLPGGRAGSWNESAGLFAGERRRWKEVQLPAGRRKNLSRVLHLQPVSVRDGVRAEVDRDRQGV